MDSLSSKGEQRFVTLGSKDNVSSVDDLFHYLAAKASSSFQLIAFVGFSLVGVEGENLLKYSCPSARLRGDKPWAPPLASRKSRPQRHRGHLVLLGP